MTIFKLFSRLILGLSLITFVAACGGSGSSEQVRTSMDDRDSVTGERSEDGYDQDPLVTEAADFLGVSAEAVGGVIESIFKKEGEPIAYIKAEEAGGGLIVGLRYGGGTLQHKLEGESPVHWTGPSIGFDIGGEVAKVFALVYDLHDVNELYKRFGAVEGQLYYVAGMGVSFIQRGDIVIAVIRVGVGLRAQASLGYYKFSRKRKLIPF